jgi:hypothetical protein
VGRGAPGKSNKFTYLAHQHGDKRGSSRYGRVEAAPLLPSGPGDLSVVTETQRSISLLMHPSAPEKRRNGVSPTLGQKARRAIYALTWRAGRLLVRSGLSLMPPKHRYSPNRYVEQVMQGTGRALGRRCPNYTRLRPKIAHPRLQITTSGKFILGGLRRMSRTRPRSCNSGTRRVDSIPPRSSAL